MITVQVEPYAIQAPFECVACDAPFPVETLSFDWQNSKGSQFVNIRFPLCEACAEAIRPVALKGKNGELHGDLGFRFLNRSVSDEDWERAKQITHSVKIGGAFLSHKLNLTFQNEAFGRAFAAANGVPARA